MDASGCTRMQWIWTLWPRDVLRYLGSEPEPVRGAGRLQCTALRGMVCGCKRLGGRLPHVVTALQFSAPPCIRPVTRMMQRCGREDVLLQRTSAVLHRGGGDGLGARPHVAQGWEIVILNGTTSTSSGSVRTCRSPATAIPSMT
eukprot:364341-Chlamydomonas_euryale.AAC.21